jgi:hypothetical protein
MRNNSASADLAALSQLKSQLEEVGRVITRKCAERIAFWQLLPAAVAPAVVPMRPDASLDPPIEFVEERSDVGTLVIVRIPGHVNKRSGKL